MSRELVTDEMVATAARAIHDRTCQSGCEVMPCELKDARASLESVAARSAMPAWYEGWRAGWLLGRDPCGVAIPNPYDEQAKP